MSGSNRYALRIAGISLALETPKHLPAEEAFLLFLCKDTSAQYTAVFRPVDRLPQYPDRVLYEDVCYRVHPDGKNGYIRSFFDETMDLAPYAVGTYDYPNGRITIDYLEKGARCVSEMSNSFFHIGFEALLIQEKKLCFHAACVDTHLGGILFSGPSGIGKSTQADLWCRYGGGRLINGDRPILSKEADGWRAWGSPYAGSSRCYVNESCPISAIVLLKQAGECSIRRLGPGEAFRGIYAGLTMYSWNREFVTAALDLAMDLSAAVPVYEFACTPEQRAVEFLEKQLREVIRDE